MSVNLGRSKHLLGKTCIALNEIDDDLSWESNFGLTPNMCIKYRGYFPFLVTVEIFSWW